MDDNVVEKEAKGLDIDIREFSKFYAEAILEGYVSFLVMKKQVIERLESDTDKLVQEVKIHQDGETHIYFSDGTHLEYKAKELGILEL